MLQVWAIAPAPAATTSTAVIATITRFIFLLPGPGQNHTKFFASRDMERWRGPCSGWSSELPLMKLSSTGVPNTNQNRKAAVTLRISSAPQPEMTCYFTVVDPVRTWDRGCYTAAALHVFARLPAKAGKRSVGLHLCKHAIEQITRVSGAAPRCATRSRERLYSHSVEGILMKPVIRLPDIRTRRPPDHAR